MVCHILCRKLSIDESVENEQSSSSSCHPPIWLFWRARRYIVTMMAFLGNINAYLLRVNLSVAIVEMTQYHNATLENGTTVEIRDFDWDSKVQGFLLSSFFYGYIFTQLMGAYLGIRYGGRVMVAIGIGGASITTLLTPVAANIHVYLFLFARILVGLFEGFIMPGSLNIYTNWAPPMERGRIVTISLSGIYLGTVICLPLSSLLASTFGWKSIFYVTGVCGCIWCVFWLLIVTNSPSSDKRISKEELRYITKDVRETITESNVKVPIWSILTSGPAWALNIALPCELWGSYTMLTQIPKFMKCILNFDLNSSGFVSALPYLFLTIVVQIGGRLLDFTQQKNKLGIGQIRKLFVFVGFVAQSVFMIVSIHWLSPVTTTFFLTLAIGMGGITMTGLSVNPLDLSPQFAGVIVGIENTFATMTGIASPIAVGYIVTEDTNVYQWRIVFCIAGGVYVAGAIIFCLLGSGELQSWNQTSVEPPNNNKDVYVQKETENQI